MSKSARPAWRGTARALVLYNPDGQWRFAIYNDSGIIDGSLADLPADLAPEAAQALLLQRVEDKTGESYAATWVQDEAHWWRANLTPPS